MLMQPSLTATQSRAPSVWYKLLMFFAPDLLIHEWVESSSSGKSPEALSLTQYLQFQSKRSYQLNLLQSHCAPVTSLCLGSLNVTVKHFFVRINEEEKDSSFSYFSTIKKQKQITLSLQAGNKKQLNLYKEISKSFPLDQRSTYCDTVCPKTEVTRFFLHSQHGYISVWQCQFSSFFTHLAPTEPRP